MDIINLTFTKPTDTTYSDACETGIGGFESESFAWRFELPVEWHVLFTINLLEFMAAAITIHITLKRRGRNRKILAFTDSTSALGWLYKSSFTHSQPSHDSVARWLARTLIRQESSLYSQHIKGKHNYFADCLSRDHHISTNQLTFAFRLFFPEQVHPNFQIAPPPAEVISWLRLVSHTLTMTPASPQPHCRSSLGALTGGGDSAREWDSKMSSLMDLIRNKRHALCPLLQRAVDEINTAKHQKRYSPEALSKPPWQMYVRPFGRIFAPTQR